jgi:hypothetical protein
MLWLLLWVVGFCLALEIRGTPSGCSFPAKSIRNAIIEKDGEKISKVEKTIYQRVVG